MKNLFLQCFCFQAGWGDWGLLRVHVPDRGGKAHAKGAGGPDHQCGQGEVSRHRGAYFTIDYVLFNAESAPDGIPFCVVITGGGGSLFFKWRRRFWSIFTQPTLPILRAFDFENILLPRDNSRMDSSRCYWYCRKIWALKWIHSTFKSLLVLERPRIVWTHGFSPICFLSCFFWMNVRIMPCVLSPKSINQSIVWWLRNVRRKGSKPNFETSRVVRNQTINREEWSKVRRMKFWERKMWNGSLPLLVDVFFRFFSFSLKFFLPSPRASVRKEEFLHEFLNFFCVRKKEGRDFVRFRMGSLFLIH